MEVKHFVNSIDFGSRLKSIRRSRNLSQNEISKKLNISRQAYANYEQGRCVPSVNILLEMSFVLNFNLFIFFFPEREKSSSSHQSETDNSNREIQKTETSLVTALYHELATEDRVALVVDMLIKLNRK